MNTEKILKHEERLLKWETYLRRTRIAWPVIKFQGIHLFA